MFFLSEDSVLKHKEYLKDLKLKYSVIEKSYPLVKGTDLKTLLSSRLPSNVRSEAAALKSKIILHELYFDSFSDKFFICDAARKYYGSEANFLYEIEREILKSEEYGFLLVFCDNKKRLRFEFSDDFCEILANASPILSLDLWEHAYFSDFGFDRKRYVKLALSHLNLSKINDFYKIY